MSHFVYACRSANRPTISLCVIVRDEETAIAECLSPLRPLVDEMIVVDTGSRDRTRELAARGGAVVVDFRWQDSFAAARNESLRHARGDWILYVDADERFDPPNLELLCTLLATGLSDPRAFLMRQWSLAPADGPAWVALQARLFPNFPGLSWRYRVHEQIIPSLLECGAILAETPIVLQHFGFQSPERRQQKLIRNRRLLEIDSSENPYDAYILFNLATSDFELGKTDSAADGLLRCIQLSAPGMSYLPKAFQLLARAQRLLGREEDALRTCKDGLDRYALDPPLLFEEGLIHQNRADWPHACRCFSAIVESPSTASQPLVSAGLSARARDHLAAATRELKAVGK